MQNTLVQPLPTSEPSASCHGPAQQEIRGLPLVAIVGTPNVGKSVLFNTLTGIYVTVSNYPGTTVEVTRGKGRLEDLETGVLDTPGMYGLLPITEEERVARRILLTERPDLVVHVIDAKNIERMLPMTLQLIEGGLPVFLVVNLMDEAERIGISIDIPQLQKELGIPVVGTALAVGRGANELKAELAAYLLSRRPDLTGARFLNSITLSSDMETALEQLEAVLDAPYPMSRRATAMLLLQNDSEVLGLVQAAEPDQVEAVRAIVSEAQSRVHQPLSYLIARAYREAAQQVLIPVLTPPGQRTAT
ncbi:MAG TPA: FeoB small GTPase domain-containing protein, partial [Anaerolineaceae bacterium]